MIDETTPQGSARRRQTDMAVAVHARPPQIGNEWHSSTPRFISTERPAEGSRSVQRRQLDILVPQRLGDIVHRLIEDPVGVLVGITTELRLDVGHYLIVNGV